MIFRLVAPRSLEWMQMRSGIPTSSEFDKIVTPAKCELSKSSDTYMYRLLSEYMVGHPITGPETDAMKRGAELEDGAIRAYEFQTDRETDPGGFFTTDDGMAGASPDRLFGTDGIIEMKCPDSHAIQMRYLLTSRLEESYRPQLQGQLWICEREWTDIVAYHPELPAKVMRVERDEEYIGKLSVAVAQFVEKMLAHREALVKEYGPPKKREGELSEREMQERDVLSSHFAITAEDEARIVADRFPVTA